MTMGIEARLHRLTWEAPGVLSLEFIRPDSAAFPAWTPGAHIDVTLPNGVTRPYSLCGDPADATRWRIAVREVAGGQASPQIHRQLRPGTTLTLSAPRNNFPLVEARRYLFIAGGIGITPILPMLRAAAAAETTLLYCVPYAAEAPFLAELGPHHLHASAEGTRLDIAARLAVPERDTHLYCCGPERLMLAVEAATAAWPPAHVHFEWFRPRSDAATGPAGGFEAICARSNRSIAIPADRSLLFMLNAAGLGIPFSCEQGVCGTCETPVLEGAIDHRDSILSAAEREAGASLMPCVSRARGARLVLDI
jgi:ferredoxin-NADP reductase